MTPDQLASAEAQRLDEDRHRSRNWKRWGPYLAERQWGTVREDYSADQNPWTYFSHDHARSRAYRWGEDGLLGFCDRRCRLAFALALWNERDPFLKERLFGLSGPEGNHGEDVKECYHYLDSTPTHSFVSSLYRYPQRAFPYAELVAENGRRSREDPEFELEDTGIFAENRFCDVLAEYAKAAPNDILIRITLTNQGPDPTTLHVLPTLWYRNTWSWGRSGEGFTGRPHIKRAGERELVADHETLGRMRLAAADGPDGSAPTWLFTENETNHARIFGTPNTAPFVKDAFDDHVVQGRIEAINPDEEGTKAAAWYRLNLEPGETANLRLRLFAEDETGEASDLDAGFEKIFALRRQGADAFYAEHIPAQLSAEEVRIARQSYAGLLHTKQFYHYVVSQWIEGDPTQVAPPVNRRQGRNHGWDHLYNRDVISMPDKWEYPWYAAWDTAFHMIPFARVDPHFAKQQLLLFLREWYMHPDGALPAYEYAFEDANPPVHAWAVWRVYKMTAARGKRDLPFLARAFQKLLLNFTWWVNRKDVHGEHLFSGGFLGLDNIGVFDRSKPLPEGGHLEQADGTAWMAFYCGTMLSMALELARHDKVYADMASKFFEHFVAIVDAMNTLGGTGLWDEDDGFYYDRVHQDGRSLPLKIRSLVGLIPLIAAEIIETEAIRDLPGFAKRLDWFLVNRPDLARHISYLDAGCGRSTKRRLLAIPSKERLVRVLGYMLDENEFLSPYGIRSLSKVHQQHPFVFRTGDQEQRVAYVPGESNTGLFGGNSNWRGPVWFPVNFLLVEALERYHHFYGSTLKVEHPTGSGRLMTLKQVARDIERRLVRLFLPDARGRRPCHGDLRPYAEDPLWRDLLLFHEYFHGESGQGLGASHQTGWTALVSVFLEKGIRK